jgi:integrase
MSEWIKCKTTGIRYRLHNSRKHGVGYDKYFTIRYKVSGKEKSEGLGWASEGMTEKTAAAILAGLKMNHTTGSGPRTLGEKRKIEDDRREKIERQEQEAAESEARDKKLILDNIFNQYCESKADKKSLKDEICYYKNWIGQTIGNKRLGQIILFDLEKIRSAMTKAGKAPRSIQYIKSIVRQIFHYAVEHKIYSGEIPTNHFLTRQKIDNKRQRYLSDEESENLLNDIKQHSLTTFRISLLSLNSGMRFSEIAGLQWQHVNTTTCLIKIMDPKNGETRTTYMTKTVIEMFNEMQQGAPDDLIFPATNGKQMVRISNVFQESVDRLGLNTGVTDRRLKLCFHSLRHSCASTLVNSGIEIPVIAKILGHKTLSMTMRYSHINDSSVKDAMAILDQQQLKQKKKRIVKIKQNG